MLCVAFALLAALAGCDLSKLHPTPAQEKAAQDTLAQLRRHDFDALEAAADPSIASPTLRDALERMAGMIPAGEPSEVRMVGYVTSSMGSKEMVNLTYEMRYPDRWLLMNAALLTQGGRRTIVGMTVRPLDGPLERQHEFSLAGKPPIDYAVLTLAIALPLFTLYALVACIRTKLRGRKWPWVVFVLLGFCTLSLNWTTGQIGLQPISVMLFSAAAVSASPFAPWILQIAFPLGAIVFLARRRQLAAPPAWPETTPTAASEPPRS